MTDTQLADRLRITQQQAGELLQQIPDTFNDRDILSMARRLNRQKKPRRPLGKR